MKILLLSHYFNPDIGGIESISEMLANEFYKAGHDIHIMTWTKKESSVSFPYGVIRNPGYKKIIREHIWADVVFENNPCLRLSWPLLFIKRPSLVSVQTWLNRKEGNKSFQDKLKIRRLKRARKVVACSDAIRQRTLPSAIVIPNPYDKNMFTRSESITKSKGFVFLGRLVSDKGAAIAIQAVSDLIHNDKEGLYSNHNITLTIIGQGPEMDALKQMVSDFKLTDVVYFTGPLKGRTLVDELNQHEFMVVPSVWEEPFGIVALEGMACGCIPIVSNGGGLPEAVGNAGYVFERNNIESLVKGISELLQNGKLRTKLQNAAPAQLSEHSVENIAKRYLRELELITFKTKN